MLTNVGNIINFRGTEKFTSKHLDAIFDCLFGGMEWIGVERIGGGFRAGQTEVMAERIIDHCDIENDTILIINDISFHSYNYLTDCGFDPTHIYLAYGEFNADGELVDNRYVVNTAHDIAENNFGEFAEGKMNILTIKEAEELGVKFNQIIVNPPYKIGNKVIKAIVDNTDFDTMVCLMPKSKYKGQGLYKYVDGIETVNSSEFEKDGATIGDCLTVATLKKEDAGKYESYEELASETYEHIFVKFYKENIKKALNFEFCVLVQGKKSKEEMEAFLHSLNIEDTFLLPLRVSANGVDLSGEAYNWNVLKSINTSQLRYTTQGANQYQTSFGYLRFNSPKEREIFTDFWYRNGKEGLIHKLIRGMHMTSGSVSPAIPRVDWSRPWTDEEILKEYGYTDEEIKEILG